jgi:hypothetical protein
MHCQLYTAKSPGPMPVLTAKHDFTLCNANVITDANMARMQADSKLPCVAMMSFSESRLYRAVRPLRCGRP